MLSSCNLGVIDYKMMHARTREHKYCKDWFNKTRQTCEMHEARLMFSL